MTSDLFSVEGRVVIVTGAGCGNGAAIAAGLARAGARVYGLDVRYEFEMTIRIEQKSAM